MPRASNSKTGVFAGPLGAKGDRPMRNARRPEWRHSGLTGIVVVITGASSGNGRASALALAQGGASVVLAARNAKALEEVARLCRAAGGAAMPVPTDVTRSEDVAELARRAVEQFGRIDAWVNCAAVLHFGRIEQTPVSVLERVISTNIIGCIHGTQAPIRQFRKQQSGILINVSSALGLVAQPFASAYVASKFAIRGLSDSVRQEVRDQPHIRVCTVFPFAVDTPIYQHAANYTGREITPIQPRYSAQDVARAIVEVVRNPVDEVHVGGLAALTGLGAALAPKATEAVVRRAVETMQIGREKATFTQGNLFGPVSDQWSISGGWGHTVSRLFERIGLVTAGLLALGWTLRKRRPIAKSSTTRR